MPEHDAPSFQWMSLFHRLVRMAYLGGTHTNNLGAKYTFQPRLVKPYDFVKEIRAPEDDFERLLSNLDSRFRSAAKSEIYRSEGGWIDSSRVRLVDIANTKYLLPVMSTDRAVGIDTSTVGETTYIIFCFMPDPVAAETYLERHLKLKKSRKRYPEFKWSDLSTEYQNNVIQNFHITLMVCCNAVLIIRTDVLAGLRGRDRDVLTNLFEGCFSGYEGTQGSQRLTLRKSLFELAKGTQIHCDPDFSVPPDDVTRIFMRTLAKREYGLEEHVPLHAALRSHESKPIQVADILVGAVRTRLDIKMSIDPLNPHPFDKRKIRKYKMRTVKAYCWIQ